MSLSYLWLQPGCFTGGVATDNASKPAISGNDLEVSTETNRLALRAAFHRNSRLGESYSNLLLTARRFDEQWENSRQESTSTITRRMPIRTLLPPSD